MILLIPPISNFSQNGKYTELNKFDSFWYSWMRKVLDLPHEELLVGRSLDILWIFDGFKKFLHDQLFWQAEHCHNRGHISACPIYCTSTLCWNKHATLIYWCIPNRGALCIATLHTLLLIYSIFFALVNSLRERFIIGSLGHFALLYLKSIYEDCIYLSRLSWNKKFAHNWETTFFALKK